MTITPAQIQPVTAAEVAARLRSNVPLAHFAPWPPNLFALTSSLLEATQAYRLLRSAPNCWPPTLPKSTEQSLAAWQQHVSHLAGEWLDRLAAIRPEDLAKLLFAPTPDLSSCLPNSIMTMWVSFEQAVTSLRDVSDLTEERNRTTLLELLELHAVADATCSTWANAYGPTNAYREHAAALLQSHGTLASIDPRRGCVLPKRHTPSVGLAVRSMSHSLAFHRSEVRIDWSSAQGQLRNGLAGPLIDHALPINCLLLPWPLQIDATHFKALPSGPSARDAWHSGYFTYSPFWNSQDKNLLKATIQKGVEMAGSIQMVVLPEAALTPEEIRPLEELLMAEGVRLYVAGVRDPNHAGATIDGENPPTASFDKNYVMMRHARRTPEGPTWTGAPQHKHHPWCLDGTQIVQYQLSSQLQPARLWWEAITIEPRTLRFLDVSPEITICSLVCEDLARQDPVAQVIRAVGPSLVVTILLDGPQLANRWSSRYAAVLADDPGSAALTLTAAGMVRRWKPLYAAPPQATVIAQWSNPGAPPREIPLEDGATGVVLSMAAEPREERTADGRLYKKFGLRLYNVQQVRT